MRPAWPVSLAVGAVALATYLWLSPGASGDRDSSEFTLVLALDGVAHPTGYALYTLVGHRFVIAAHALGASWAFAANAWSALGGALAVALLHALGVRLVPARVPATAPERWALPLLPVALLLLNPAWTQVTTVAEVYSWHQAWVMASAMFAVAWAGQAAAVRDVAPWRAVLWGLLCGAGIAHHATALLVAVPLTAVLVRSRTIPLRHATWCAGAMAVIPLASLWLLYGKAQHAGPAHWITLEDSWASVWAHSSGAQYRGWFGRFAPEPMDRALLERHVFPFLLPGLLLLGAAWRVSAAGRERRVLAGLALAALAQTAFAFGYGVEDPSAYFLPALALGLVAVVPLLGAIATAHRGPAGVARIVAAALAVLALVLGPGWARTGRDMRETFEGLDEFVHAQWRRIPVERGLVMWPRDMHQRLREYQLLRGEKAGLEVWNPWLFTHPVARRRFSGAHGFDPADDFDWSREDLRAPPGRSGGADRFVEHVVARIHANTALPVILFEPEIPRVTVLPEREPAAH